MIRMKISSKTCIEQNEAYEAEPLHERLERMIAGEEPIEAGDSPIYTERKMGVVPGYDIRTDRFEVAQEAMGKVQKGKLAKRMEILEGGKTETEKTEIG